MATFRNLSRFCSLGRVIAAPSSSLRRISICRLSTFGSWNAAGFRSSICSSRDICEHSATNVFRKANVGLAATQQVFPISKRNYGGKPPYSLKTVHDRVMLVIQLFDKINPDKLTLDSHFINDLGLDSLDHVEIMLHLEKEFLMEIPDGDAEQLMTPRKIIQYICDAEDIFE